MTQQNNENVSTYDRITFLEQELSEIKKQLAIVVKYVKDKEDSRTANIIPPRYNLFGSQK